MATSPKSDEFTVPKYLHSKEEEFVRLCLYYKAYYLQESKNLSKQQIYLEERAPAGTLVLSPILYGSKLVEIPSNFKSKSESQPQSVEHSSNRRDIEMDPLLIPDAKIDNSLSKVEDENNIATLYEKDAWLTESGLIHKVTKWKLKPQEYQNSIKPTKDQAQKFAEYLAAQEYLIHWPGDEYQQRCNLEGYLCLSLLADCVPLSGNESNKSVTRSRFASENYYFFDISPTDIWDAYHCFSSSLTSIFAQDNKYSYAELTYPNLSFDQFKEFKFFPICDDSQTLEIEEVKNDTSEKKKFNEFIRQKCQARLKSMKPKLKQICDDISLGSDEVKISQDAIEKPIHDEKYGNNKYSASYAQSLNSTQVRDLFQALGLPAIHINQLASDLLQDKDKPVIFRRFLYNWIKQQHIVDIIVPNGKDISKFVDIGALKLKSKSPKSHVSITNSKSDTNNSSKPRVMFIEPAPSDLGRQWDPIINELTMSSKFKLINQKQSRKSIMINFTTATNSSITNSEQPNPFTSSQCSLMKSWILFKDKLISTGRISSHILVGANTTNNSIDNFTKDDNSTISKWESAIAYYVGSQFLSFFPDLYEELFFSWYFKIHNFFCSVFCCGNQVNVPTNSQPLYVKILWPLMGAIYSLSYLLPFLGIIMFAIVYKQDSYQLIPSRVPFFTPICLVQILILTGLCVHIYRPPRILPALLHRVKLNLSKNKDTDNRIQHLSDYLKQLPISGDKAAVEKDSCGEVNKKISKPKRATNWVTIGSYAALVLFLISYGISYKYLFPRLIYGLFPPHFIDHKHLISCGDQHPFCPRFARLDQGAYKDIFDLPLYDPSVYTAIVNGTYVDPGECNVGCLAPNYYRNLLVWMGILDIHWMCLFISFIGCFYYPMSIYKRLANTRSGLTTMKNQMYIFDFHDSANIRAFLILRQRVREQMIYDAWAITPFVLSCVGSAFATTTIIVLQVWLQADAAMSYYCGPIAWFSSISLLFIIYWLSRANSQWNESDEVLHNGKLELELKLATITKVKKKPEQSIIEASDKKVIKNDSNNIPLDDNAQVLHNTNPDLRIKSFLIKNDQTKSDQHIIDGSDKQEIKSDSNNYKLDSNVNYSEEDIEKLEQNAKLLGVVIQGLNQQEDKAAFSVFGVTINDNFLKGAAFNFLIFIATQIASGISFK